MDFQKIAVPFSFSLLFLALGFGIPANAFPEMVRHGYPNCVACHVSPTGGGVMSEYGRGLSKELLSTWAYENEELPGHGLLPAPPEWLHPGGDVRFIQTYRNDPSLKQGDFFLMQADLEAAVTFQKWTVDASVGLQGGPEGTPEKNNFLSRRHFVNYRPTDEWSFRAGKFQPAFGINNPNHTITTRAGVGFDEGTERYNLESAYLGEKFDAFLTGIFGRPDTDKDASDVSSHPYAHEKGVSASASAWIYEAYKIGVSGLAVQNNTSKRELAGVWGILGFTKKIYVLTEEDLQWQKPKLSGSFESRGFFSYNRLGYELYKGMHIYLAHQLGYSDFNTVNSRTDSFNIGAELFPRPHFDLMAEYRRQRNISQFSQYYDYAYLQFHYYL